MPNSIRQALATAVEWIRSSGLTQERLSDLTGLSPRLFGYAQSRDAWNPRSETLARIIDAMEVELGHVDNLTDPQRIAQGDKSANSKDAVHPCGENTSP